MILFRRTQRASIFAWPIYFIALISFSNTASGASCGNTWLPWPWTVYKDRTFTQRNNCGQTRTWTGTKDHLYWKIFEYKPATSTVCKNTMFTQTLNGYNGYTTTRPNWGTSNGSNWQPVRSEVCIGQSFVQTSSCGVFRTSTGTKPVGSFSPDPSTKACGVAFTQTRTCGSSRTAYGTAPSSDWTPATNTICVGESFQQTRSCGAPRTVVGTKVTQDWTPAVNTVCQGVTFIQSRTCGESQEAVGTKTTDECAADDAINAEDPYPFQSDTQCPAV